ncbi:MAG: sulfite oxidase heme-binding subunit YedZ [Methylophagaceae bacterium]
MSSRLFKGTLFIVFLMPLVVLLFGLFNEQLGANPIEVLTRDTGQWALRFLLISLSISPLRLLFGWHFLAPIRRMVGLYCFFYASVHMLLYIWLDQFFNLGDIIDDIIERPFITVGVISFLALIPLAVTSNDKMKKRLGSERWKKLHSLVYFIGMAGALHFFMLVKKDITEPLIYIAILVILLGIRLFRYGRRKLISF